MSPHPMEAAPSERHAVVLGGGMAGLAAARVLADHFDQVTVVEPDRAPAEPGPRVGVPQSHHIHVLLERGKQVLEELFPGLQADLAAAGAVPLNATRDLLWLTPAGWGVRYESAMDGHACSRGLLEWVIRRRLARHPRIQFVEGYAACGLIADPAGSRVVGARVRLRRPSGEPADDEGAIEAELVVDATGRGSRAGDWLRALGYGPATTTEINAFLGYATRQYRLRPDPRRDWRGLYLQLAPPAHLRSGALLPVEGDRWIATLWGAGRDYPPTDEAGYLAFARSLRSPLLYESIKDAEPLTPIRPTRSTANVWHHYERLARWPDGFIAVGDAVCAFDPVYGQGMSVGAMEALVLDQSLTEQRANRDLGGFARAFQRRLARTIEPVWLIATGEDARVPGVEGARPGPAAGLLYRYLDRITALSTEDPVARQALLDVLGLVKPTTTLFRPGLLARALRGPRQRTAGPVGHADPVAITTAT